MAEITTQMVKELRQATNAGVLDCKKALADTDGNFDDAVEILRKKGLSSAAKKATRETTEGLIGHYVHAGGRMAGIVELACETDFVARTEQFQKLAHDLSMHVVAARPEYVNRDEVPGDVLEREMGIFREQAISSGKPEHILDKIIEGKIDKWYSEVCFLEQGFIRDPDKSIQDLLTDNIAALGENIRINAFARLAIGE